MADALRDGHARERKYAEEELHERLQAPDERPESTPYFIATKFEAFKGRGNRDFMGSHDLEDLIAVVDGRESLVSEVRGEPAELRGFLREEVSELLRNANLIDALPGYLLPDTVSQARLPVVRRRLLELLG